MQAGARWTTVVLDFQYFTLVHIGYEIQRIVITNSWSLFPLWCTRIKKVINSFSIHLEFISSLYFVLKMYYSCLYELHNRCIINERVINNFLFIVSRLNKDTIVLSLNHWKTKRYTFFKGWMGTNEKEFAVDWKTTSNNSSWKVKIKILRSAPK